MSHPATERREPTGAVPAAAICCCCAIVLPLLGCGRDLETGYGRRWGPNYSNSVNGTAVLAEMFTAAGHEVFSWGVLSPRLRTRADCIVWFPADLAAPSEAARRWLDDWLAADRDRTLVYVGPGYDAEADYWRAALGQVAVDERPRYQQRLDAAVAWNRWRRGQAQWPLNAGWCQFDRLEKPRRAADLGGDAAWLRGVDPAQTDIELAATMRPRRRFQKMVLAGGDVLVAQRDRDGGRLLLVANGSFLVNAGLVNREHRKLAGKLIAAVGEEKTVAFLEADSSPAILDEDPQAKVPTGLEIFLVAPINWLAIHAALAGIVFCFSRWPIFGVAHRRPPPPLSDFGRHIEAVAEHLQRRRDAAYANARVEAWRSLRAKAGGRR